MTTFTNCEEADVQATNIVPFHHAAANWSNHVVEDGRLVNGQNSASATGVGGKTLEKFLAEQKK